MAMVSFGIFVAQPIWAVRLSFEATTNRAQARAPVPRSKPHDVVAAIDEDRLAGNARARFGKQECGGPADLAALHISLHRTPSTFPFNHLTPLPHSLPSH